MKERLVDRVENLLRGIVTALFPFDFLHTADFLIADEIGIAVSAPHFSVAWEHKSDSFAEVCRIPDSLPRVLVEMTYVVLLTCFLYVYNHHMSWTEHVMHTGTKDIVIPFPGEVNMFTNV